MTGCRLWVVRPRENDNRSTGTGLRQTQLMAWMSPGETRTTWRSTAMEIPLAPTARMVPLIVPSVV